MLEKVPSVIGEALHGVRAGLDETLARRVFAAVPETVTVESADFAPGAPLPRESTADGEGIAPAIAWSNLPPGTAEVVLVIEDADSPTPAPLVHAIAYGLPAGGHLPSGAMNQEAGGPPMGTNSFGKARYLPPDPPTGHGAHRYVFQVFALGSTAGLSGTPGRRETVEALTGRVLAKGVLIGTYERP